MPGIGNRRNVIIEQAHASAYPERCSLCDHCWSPCLCGVDCA